MRAGNLTGDAQESAVAWRDPRLLAAIALLFGVAALAAQLGASIALSADLRAIWGAGQFWQMGRVDEIYPPAGELFELMPPEGWRTWFLEEHGYGGEIFPFIYPPLWAAVAGVLLPDQFEPVAIAALWVNAGLLAGTAVLAIRAVGVGVSPLVQAVLVLLIWVFTPIASVGLLQGQPHILVAFLMVLAIERSRAGAPVAAGAALALAASIKLFPLLFVAIWIGQGDRRALIAFAVTGAALAGASVILAGWPLHQTFLDTIAQIGRTLLVTKNNVSLDAVMTRLFWMDEAHVIHGLTDNGTVSATSGYFVRPRAAGWALFANAALLASAAAIALAARRATPTALYAGLWPLLLTLSVLFTPTGWIYYMIPVAVFAPALLACQPVARGAGLFFLGFFFFLSGRLELFSEAGALTVPPAFLHVAGALAWGLGFALMARHKGDE